MQALSPSNLDILKYTLVQRHGRTRNAGEGPLKWFRVVDGKTVKLMESVYVTP